MTLFRFTEAPKRRSSSKHRQSARTQVADTPYLATTGNGVAESLRRLRFILNYAIRDLFPLSCYGKKITERLRTLLSTLGSSVPALMNIATLSVLVLTITVMAGLYKGATAWLKDYINNNRMARTIPVSAIFGTHNATLHPEDVQQMAFIASVEGRRLPSGAFGWNDMLIWFYKANGQVDDDLTHGRSVDPEDEVLGKLEYFHRDAQDRMFEGDGIGQVVVSSSVVKGVEPDGDGSLTMYVRYHDMKAPVRVVGVAGHIPDGDFLVTEAFNRALNDETWDPVKFYDRVYLGPIADQDRQEEAIDSTVAFGVNPRTGVAVSLVQRAGTERWLECTRPKSSAWSRRDWEDRFASVVRTDYFAGAAELKLEFGDAMVAKQSRIPAPIQYTRASVYVDSLEDVPTVVDRLLEMGYRVTGDVKGLAIVFIQIRSLGVGILFAVIVIVGVLSGASLGLSVAQNIQRKVPEISILKAFGAKNRIVLSIYIFEALFVWIAAMVIGNLSATPIASIVNKKLVDIFANQASMQVQAGQLNLIDMSLPLVVWVGVGTLALSCSATLIGGSLALRLRPAEGLRGQNQ